MKCVLVAEKNYLMLNWYGVYSGKVHVNSRLTLLRLFIFHKPDVLNFLRNMWRGFHIVGKNLVCFNCWAFPHSFFCEELHLNCQWLAELLNEAPFFRANICWSTLTLHIFFRIRGLLTLFIHSDHQTWTYSFVVLLQFFLYQSPY